MEMLVSLKPFQSFHVNYVAVLIVTISFFETIQETSLAQLLQTNDNCISVIDDVPLPHATVPWHMTVGGFELEVLCINCVDYNNMISRATHS